MNEGESSNATGLPVAGSATAATPKQEVDQQLQHAQEQLMKLRRLQEDLERQKGDLEELRRKQDDYSRGRAAAIEDLTRGMVLLEREQIQAQRLGELCGKTRQSFNEYLEQVQGIRDQDWTSTNLRAELTKALGIIENARIEYNRACAKLDCLNPAKAAALTGKDEDAFDSVEFRRYVCRGAAASLPLIVAGTVWLIVFLLAQK
jgi:DNA repair exonuclease SbcCD ATPase subunit